VYQFKRRADYLARTCVTWQGQVRSIDNTLDKDTWGPTEAFLQEAAAFESQGSWVDHSDGAYNMGEDSDSEVEADGHAARYEPYSDMEDEDYGELLDAIETQALTDAYHIDEEFPTDFHTGLGDLAGNNPVASSSQPHAYHYSPRKRSHFEVD